MKKILLPLIISFVLLFSACDATSGYKKLEKFDDLRLPSETEFVFEFDNIDPTQEYDIIILFRYAEGFQFPQIVLDFGMQIEGNDKVTMPIGIPVITTKGKYIGDGSGDIWDIEQIVLSKKALPKGKTTFTLKSAMPYDYIPMVMELGIQIKKSE